MEFAKAKAIQRMESEEDEIADDAPLDIDKQELVSFTYFIEHKSIKRLENIVKRHI